MADVKYESEAVAKKFIDMLKNGELKNDKRPNTGPVRDEKYTEKDVESFRKLMNTGIVNDMLNM